MINAHISHIKYNCKCKAFNYINIIDIGIFNINSLNISIFKTNILNISTFNINIFSENIIL